MNKALRVLLLFFLIVIAAFTLSACKVPDPVVTDDEPTPSPSPTLAPTMFIPTPDPTITPRPMEGLQPLEVNATPILIDPFDKPTPPPLTFSYTPVNTEISDALGVTFEVPNDWDVAMDPNSKTVEYKENPSRIQSGTNVQAFVVVSVSEFSSNRTLDDAKGFLDEQITQMRTLYGDKIEVSSRADRKLMSKDGVYISYWIKNYDDITDLMVRGRVHVVAVDRKIYMIRTLWPADYNQEYDDKVYKTIRNTLKAL